jgi:DNA mismatch endonuclease (patch repair protein)
MLPELAVRSLVQKMGYRFRLHRKDLPGKPDLVFASSRKVIFVHGCFCHAHACKTAHTPKSNTSYWRPKLQRNRVRDKRNLKALTALGWKSLIIWECEVMSRPKLESKLAAFLR